MSSGMSEYLAEFYGTTKTASAPQAAEDGDLQKQAQVELFCKVAAEQNIDIQSMSDDQVEQLFTNFVNNTKVAADKSEGDEDEKKKETATKELEEKKAEAAEFARYDFFGRQMAHAYVDELKKIAAATKVAEFPPNFFKKKDDDGGKDKADDKGDKEPEKKKDDKEQEKKASHLGSLVAPPKMKKASAIDELAFTAALKKVAEAGYDPTEAGHRINAAITLSLLGESTKLASVANVEQAVEVRALEMLEAARYPVQWAEPTAA